MKKRLKIIPLLTCMIVAAVLIGGCNIFDFASDAEKSPTEKAEDAIREGDYAKARKELAPAVKDSLDSASLYLNAQATLLDADIDLATILDIIETQDNLVSGANNRILDTIDKLPDQEKTNWYRTNTEIRANLARIWTGKTTGVFKKDDITFGFTVANLMSGILGLRDTNRDGYIDANDFQIDLAFIQNIGTNQTSGFNIDGAKIKDNQGQIIEDVKLDGLTVFLGEWQQKIAPGQKISAQRRYQPDDINPLIAFVMTLLSDGADGILLLLVDEDTTAYEVEKIKSQINNVADIINFYWYDDGIDNDGDGLIDEEIINGIDDDGDGLIDEDTNWHPTDPTTQENTEYHHIWEAWNNR